MELPSTQKGTFLFIPVYADLYWKVLGHTGRGMRVYGLIASTASAIRTATATIAPDEAHYPEALHADIRREAERLSMLENPTPENTKRLAQLLEAAKALSERPQDARAIAEGLYGLT